MLNDKKRMLLSTLDDINELLTTTIKIIEDVNKK